MMSEDKSESMSGEVSEKSETKQTNVEGPTILEKEPVIKSAPNAFNVPRKLVDYSSESGSSSQDSESDSSDSAPVKKLSESEDSSESSSDDDIEEIVKPIEEISITAPPEQCKEIGKVKNILDNQVVVEPNVGLAALDLDTVLFLDEGRKSFGRVDDVFGPIAEPLYIVLLPSAASVAAKGIKPGMKVYYAPSTSHTTYVFLPDLIKMKGSDASWKHNQEAPAELQEFSDDEEEAKARGISNVQRGGYRQGNPRFTKRTNRNFDRRPPPSWMPPIRPPLMNIPHYPPPSAAAYNPNVPPPSIHVGPQYYASPVNMMQPPPPPPPAVPSTSQQVQQPYPQVQDMRFWNKK